LISYASSSLTVVSKLEDRRLLKRAVSNTAIGSDERAVFRDGKHELRERDLDFFFV
jgi:hypothetical protein